TAANACVLTTAADRTALASSLTALETASAGQVSQTPAEGGNTWILVKTDGSTSPVTLNGRGLVCVPACDGTTGTVPGTDNFIAFQVTGIGGTLTRGSTVKATATQNGVSVDSTQMTVVGQARNLTL